MRVNEGECVSGRRNDRVVSSEGNELHGRNPPSSQLAVGGRRRIHVCVCLCVAVAVTATATVTGAVRVTATVTAAVDSCGTVPQYY